MSTITLHPRGDFFEAYDYQAQLVAEALDIRTFSKDMGGEPTTVSYVPRDAFERWYRGRLEAAGHTVTFGTLEPITVGQPTCTQTERNLLDWVLSPDGHALHTALLEGHWERTLPIFDDLVTKAKG